MGMGQTVTSVKGSPKKIGRKTVNNKELGHLMQDTGKTLKLCLVPLELVKANTDQII